MGNDPYLINVKKNEEFKLAFSGKKKGIFCPKRNTSIGGECKVCDESQRLFNTGVEKDKDKAYDTMAKPNIYMCVVFPEKPDKLMLMELGKKVGSQIINGVTSFGWTDIAHPGKGKGRGMNINKSKGDSGYNAYNASIEPNLADWAIPKSVLSTLPDLRDIIELLEAGEIEVFKISSIKMDETLKFRICPPKDKAEGLPWVPVFRHWGVSQEQIDGTAPMRVDESASVEDDIPEDAIFQEEPVQETSEPKKPPCFGKEVAFDEDDPECNKDCSFFKSCMKTVG